MSRGFFKYRIGRRSLTTRIIWFVLIVAIVLVCTTSFISFHIAERAMYENLETRGAVLGPLATLLLAAPMYLDDDARIQGTIRNLMESDGAISQVHLAYKDREREWLRAEPWTEMAEQLKSEGETGGQVVVYRNGDGLHILGPVRYKDALVGMVGLVLGLGAVETLKEQVIFWIVIMGTVVLILTMTGILLYLRKSVHGPLKRLSRAASQVTTASHNISNASQRQSAAMREQSAVVSETTSASTELAKSSEQVGENIQKVMEVTDHTMVGMGEIKKTIGRVSDRIMSLSEKSKKIGKITELIEDVADQTNLLAVNAAIEAARAGEHGRGFTVVADEIRKLSDSTAKSTREITALIEEIQHEIANASVSMERSMESVDEEVRLSKESAERAKEITMSVRQQISGSKQIAEAIGDINKVMKEIDESAQHGRDTANQLSVMADELKGIMESFNVSTNGDEAVSGFTGERRDIPGPESEG